MQEVGDNETVSVDDGSEHRVLWEYRVELPHPTRGGVGRGHWRKDSWS